MYKHNIKHMYNIVNFFLYLIMPDLWKSLPVFWMFPWYIYLEK